MPVGEGVTGAADLPDHERLERFFKRSAQTAKVRRSPDHYDEKIADVS